MAKILFVPFSLVAGLLAGIAGKQIFEFIWSRLDREEPPDASHREVGWGKLLAAAALQGAVFRATRTATDRGSRQAFWTLTGLWPGEEGPEEKGD